MHDKSILITIWIGNLILRRFYLKLFHEKYTISELQSNNEIGHWQAAITVSNGRGPSKGGNFLRVISWALSFHENRFSSQIGFVNFEVRYLNRVRVPIKVDALISQNAYTTEFRKRSTQVHFKYAIINNYDALWRILPRGNVALHTPRRKVSHTKFRLTIKRVFFTWSIQRHKNAKVFSEARVNFL